MSVCDKLDAVRDYAMGELAVAERASVEAHLAGCGECASELDGLRITTSALRILPDREIPQRIAFVSDKVFQPSRGSRVWAALWKQGLVAASVIAAALIVAAPQKELVKPINNNVVQAPQPARNVQAVDVDQAIAKAVAQVRREDAQTMKAMLFEASRKQEQEHRAVMEAIGILQERQNTVTLLASSDSGRTGAGQ